MRVGIAGAGLHCELHLVGYALLFDVGVVAATDIVPGRAEQIAREHGTSRVIDSVGSLAAADAIDLVDVITPRRAHLEPVPTSLQAGEPVPCEKPLAIDLTAPADLTSFTDGPRCAERIDTTYPRATE